MKLLQSPAHYSILTVSLHYARRAVLCLLAYPIRPDILHDTKYSRFRVERIPEFCREVLCASIVIRLKLTNARNTVNSRT